MKIRCTIDIDETDNNVADMGSLETGVYGCDKDGLYHMWYGTRTNLITFNDIEIIEGMKEYTDEELREWKGNDPPEGYLDCPYCLHGWARDVPPDYNDEECWYCNFTGFLKKDNPIFNQSRAKKNELCNCGHTADDHDKGDYDACLYNTCECKKFSSFQMK